MINKMEISSKAALLRKKLGENESSPIDIFQLVQTIDKLTLVFYPLNNNISGICYKGKSSNVIVVNSDMSIGRQRFSLAHELYHLYFDESGISSVSLTTIGKGDENEKKADQFASYFLIPQSSLYGMIESIKEKNKNDKLNIEDVIKIEQYYGVSHKAILYRLMEEGEINSEDIKSMEIGVITLAARLGYDTAIYYPSAKDKKKMVLGHYIALAEKLLDEEYISYGKYEEILLDGFRDDIVYGIEGEDGVILD